MKKLIVAIISVLAIVAFTVPASATFGKKCPQGQEKKGWKCVDIETPSGGSSATIGDIKNTNTNINTAFGGAGGDGGNATVKNSGNSNNENKNYNTNVNSNRNTNMNTNKQAQGQLQGQAQLQGQGQSQTGIVSNDIRIEDNRKTVQNIVDFNHITPDIGRTSAEHRSVHDTMDVKASSNINALISTITMEMSRKLGKDTKDYEVFEELLFENDFRTTMLRNGVPKNSTFMGSIIFTPTGSKVTLGGLSGRAYEAAMNAGATHYRLEYSVGQYTQGSKAGFDLGSAASVAAKANGSAVIAPGATLGYSTAWSSNEYRAGVIIDLYFDATMTITPKAKPTTIITR